MSTWIAILAGLAGGTALVAAALFFALRPYLYPRVKPWMPDATGEETAGSGGWYNGGNLPN